MPTIPPETCAVLHGKYHDYKIAKFGCHLDDGCIAVVDKGCDRIGPFQLCDKKRWREGKQTAICQHPPLNYKGRMIPHMAKLISLKIINE